MIFPLLVAERSVRKRAVNPRKLHAVDWALGYPFVPEQRIDVGRKLETAVFLHWRRQREGLGYFGGEREIDLVLNPERPQVVINVAFSVSQPQTWEREIGALEAAAVRAPDAERILVVHERPQRAPPASIQLVDAWRYLLGESPERPVRAQRSHAKTSRRRRRVPNHRERGTGFDRVSGEQAGPAEYQRRGQRVKQAAKAYRPAVSR